MRVAIVLATLLVSMRLIAFQDSPKTPCQILSNLEAHSGKVVVRRAVLIAGFEEVSFVPESARGRLLLMELASRINSITFGQIVSGFPKNCGVQFHFQRMSGLNSLAIKLVWLHPNTT